VRCTTLLVHDITRKRICTLWKEEEKEEILAS